MKLVGKYRPALWFLNRAMMWIFIYGIVVILALFLIPDGTLVPLKVFLAITLVLLGFLVVYLIPKVSNLLILLKHLYQNHHNITEAWQPKNTDLYVWDTHSRNMHQIRNRTKKLPRAIRRFIGLDD